MYRITKKGKKLRSRRYVRDRTINIKCRHCGKIFECFIYSLCNQLSLCKECISKMWGKKDFIEYLEGTDYFTQGDISFYKKLFNIKK